MGRRIGNIVGKAACLALLFAVGCSGSAVVEPGSQTSKRAKLAIEKCVPPGGDDPALKEVYACISVEDVCPAPSDPLTKEELGYVLNKFDETCGTGTLVFDVLCGPDLNAPVDCCYVARMETIEGGCD
ncbi:MAG: hypothetical protein IPK82_16270 [Polyangiaceae bacterium]|nr:hypothetical protein [Polyangiaceae bacterium]